jgi:hypothetical protein
MSVKSDIVKEYLEKFPKTKILTLAKKIYAENQFNFLSVDNVRELIRYWKGHKPGGKAGAKIQADGLYHPSDPRFISPKTFDSSAFRLPDSWYEPPQEHKLPIGCSRVLWLSDFQNPFICERSVEMALTYGMKKNVNAVILNGDVFDHFATSRHEKNPKHINWKAERVANETLLKTIREAFPDAVIWFKDGNHEKNLIKYYMLKAVEIFDEEFHNIAEFYKLDGMRIKSITGNDTIRVGNLTAWHGDEFLGTGGNVNPAKNYFDKVKTDVVVSHIHKTFSYAVTDYYSKLYRAYTLGCLCGLKPKWMPINAWNNGFGYQDVDASGEYEFLNIRIDGRKYHTIL